MSDNNPKNSPYGKISVQVNIKNHLPCLQASWLILAWFTPATTPLYLQSWWLVWWTVTNWFYNLPYPFNFSQIVLTSSYTHIHSKFAEEAPMWVWHLSCWVKLNSSCQTGLKLILVSLSQSILGLQNGLHQLSSSAWQEGQTLAPQGLWRSSGQFPWGMWSWISYGNSQPQNREHLQKKKRNVVIQQAYI